MQSKIRFNLRSQRNSLGRDAVNGGETSKAAALAQSLMQASPQEREARRSGR